MKIIYFFFLQIFTNLVTQLTLLFVWNKKWKTSNKLLYISLGNRHKNNSLNMIFYNKKSNFIITGCKHFFFFRSSSKNSTKRQVKTFFSTGNCFYTFQNVFTHYTQIFITQTNFAKIVCTLNLDFMKIKLEKKIVQPFEFTNFAFLCVHKNKNRTGRSAHIYTNDTIFRYQMSHYF